MQKSISKLKKELDAIFSLFIRLRKADGNGYITCYTCSAFKHYKKGMQCGHFQSRRFMSTRFNEENCQNQCVKCNMFNQGMQYEFSKRLDQEYGSGKAEELVLLSHQTLKMMRYEYLDKITYYKGLVENLKIERQIE